MSVCDVLKNFQDFSDDISSSTPLPIAKLARLYDGYGLLMKYDELAEQGLLSNSYPFVSLYKELSPEERLDIFPALIGLKALTNPRVQKDILDASCSIETIQSLCFLNEYYSLLDTSGVQQNIKSLIVSNLLESRCPVKIVPSSIISSRTYIKDYCLYNRDLANGVLFHKILNANEYDPMLEKALKYSLDFESIEEFLRNRFIKEKEVRDSTWNIDLIELVVSKLYILKLLETNKTKINEFTNNTYTEDVLENDSKTYGRYVPSLKLIELFPFMINTLRGYVVASSHESYHAIQDRNVAQGDIFADPDIDIYSMDQFLRETLGEKYYEDNYYTIGIESDAETKAQIDATKIEGPKAERESFENLKNTIEKLGKKESDTLSQIKSNIPYFYIMTRTHNGSRTKLTTLFTDIINEEYEKAEDKEKFKEEILSKYPIFKYTLSWGPHIKIKQPKNYITDLENANAFDALVYIQLIVNSFNDLRCPNQDKVRKELYDKIMKSSLTHQQKSLLITAIEKAIDKFDAHLRKGVN